MSEEQDVAEVVTEEEVTEEDATEVAEEAVKEPEEAPEEPGIPRARLNEEIERRKKAEELAKVAEAKVEAQKRANTKALDVEDYLKINKAFAGLEDAEQAQLAKWHQDTGRPLSELRESEDFTLWQTGYKLKVEKEKALKPTSNQPEFQSPKTLEETLQGASIDEKEKLLIERGLWKPPRRYSDPRYIGK